jgi:hypothetical protein
MDPATISMLVSAGASLINKKSKPKTDNVMAGAGAGTLSADNAPPSKLGMFGSAFADNASKMLMEKGSSMFEKSPAKLGRDKHDYLSNAYPGTNPWEHLGATGNAYQGEKAKLSQELRVMKIQHAHEKKIAEINTKPQLLQTALLQGQQPDKLNMLRYGSAGQILRTLKSDPAIAGALALAGTLGSFSPFGLLKKGFRKSSKKAVKFASKKYSSPKGRNPRLDSVGLAPPKRNKFKSPY